MKLKTIIPMLLAAAISVVGFQACKQANLKPEGLQMAQQPSNPNGTPYNPAILKSELEDGVVSFVKSVKFAYTPGISQRDFKETLIGAKNLSSIPSAGDKLLNKAHQLLANNATDSLIKAQATLEFAEATLFVLEYAQANNLAAHSEEASNALFGGDESAFRSSDDGPRPCKWYQIGCHLSNLVDWIENHPKTVQVIIQIIQIIILL
jgi:hypothetical protein